MKNKFYSRPIAVFLTFVFLFGLFPPFAFSLPDGPQHGEIKGFNKSVFDSHFSRADRELNPERWLNEAKAGMTLALHAWEMAAESLYDNPLLFEEAKNRLEKWSEEELETRFTKWLSGRFFGDAVEKAVMDFSASLAKTQKNYSWRLDEEGNILFDSVTGDPLVIRPGGDENEFSADLSLWKNETANLLKQNAFSLDAVLSGLYPELLSYIPQELRENISAMILQAGANAGAAVKREFENIAAREERIFTSRRTRDIQSLRKKSDDEAAKIFTEKLIAETEEACIKGIDELNAKIEAAYAGTGDLAILGEEWLSLYKEQFDRGLKAWEEAEERFFIRRIEWEQDAFRLFSEGEETWLAAFEKFEEERQKWELNAKELFNTGVALFMNISEAFEKNITDAKKEFELNAAMRIGEGTTKVKALVDMYLTCSSASFSAMENVEYWRSQYGGVNIPDLQSESFGAWLSNELKKNNNLILKELNKSYTLYVSYREKALDARERILTNYAELLGTGALKDILSPGASSEDFTLDEYQIALVRAKALVIYWEKKTAIAEAVIAYADELTAGRMTDAEGKRAFEAAKTAYNESLALYEKELAKLNSTGENLKGQQEILNILVREMSVEEEKLTKLNSEYSALLSASSGVRSEFYLTDFNEKYVFLVEGYKLFQKTGAQAEYAKALEYGLMWGIAKDLEDMENAEDPEYLEYLKNQFDLYNEIHDSLQTLFSNLNLTPKNVFIPDAKTIVESIQKKPGDFVNNISLFLLEFDNCFPFIPMWLVYEINSWKNAIIEYAAAYMFYSGLCIEDFYDEFVSKRAETKARRDWFSAYIAALNEISPDEKEYLNKIFEELNADIILLGYTEHILSVLSSYNDDKHWRQYLTDDYLTFKSPELTASLTQKDGILADAMYNAAYYTNRINDSLALFAQKDAYIPEESAEFYFDLYESEYHKVSYRYSLLNNQYDEIAYLGRAYEFSMTSKNEADQKLQASYNALKDQESIYNAKRNEYFREADVFLNAGALYDEQYSVLKLSHENTEQKRFEYEKQDAIQRWAATAYLGADYDSLENCKTKLEKAQTVLAILSGIYDRESRRPYENSEYEALYSAYEQSFRIKLKTLEAITSVLTETENEKNNNAKLYMAYRDAIYGLANPETNYTYFQDVITYKNGRIVFSKDENWRFTKASASDKTIFENLLASTAIPEGERYAISEYEKSLRELGERMAGYFSNEAKYYQWSLARNFFLLTLIQANGDYPTLNQYYCHFGNLTDPYSSLGSTSLQTGIVYYYDIKQIHELFDTSFNMSFYYAYYLAWETLSEEEKADLEFYTIVTLADSSAGSYYGFSQISHLEALNYAYFIANDYFSTAKNKKGKWYNIGLSWEYGNMMDVNLTAMYRILPVLYETSIFVLLWEYGLSSSLSSMQKYSSEYEESCKKLALLEAAKTDGEAVTWEDIKKTLLISENFNNADIDGLKIYWEQMINESNKAFVTVSDALADLHQWAKDLEEKSKIALEKRWAEDKQNQQRSEIKYQSAVDDYIAGNTDIESVKIAAENAFGENTAAWKNHLGNIQSLLLNNLSEYSDSKFDFYSLFDSLADEITAITTATLENKYNAELAARESEWQLTFKDLSEKQNEWLASAALILENGRSDWSASLVKMEDAYKKWTANFQSEYDRVSSEWAQVYLAGLEDKENWLQQAAEAANYASSAAFLSLVGTEGERLSRFIDTREPFGIRDAVPEAETLMAELLRSSGINNMYAAFSSINGIAGTSSTNIKRGVAGSTWDSSLAKIAASDLARSINSDLAEREALKLAYNARLTADEAVKGLESSVAKANQNFRRSMDDNFIINGLWRRYGNGYVKDIVKGSTLFDSVISQTVVVAGYNDYVMEPFSLKTNMDEHYLASLDLIAIRGLVENVYTEVEAKTAEIFGIGEDSIIIAGLGIIDDRKQSPGKFGAHIGFSPAFVAPDLFLDYGSGELGRLLYQYIYWKTIDSKGLAEIALPPWDKRIWNDDGSFFKAPSLRSTGQIASTIAAGTVSVAAGIAFSASTFGAGSAVSLALLSAFVSTASELTFSALDVGYGYTTLDTAAFNVGKSFLINSANSLLGVAFGAATSALTSFETIGIAQKIAGHTVLAGTQAATTGLISNTISGITYNSKEGFGFSTEAVRAGMKGTLTNMATSMASAFVSSSLTGLNSGRALEKLIGFNQENKTDLKTFNDLAGSLAGQGVNYALGNDFTLNVFNLTMFDQLGVSGGLLELHLGRNGMTMNFGTGGANISIDNMMSALRGLDVWGTNLKIEKYVDKKENSFKSAIALRSLYGYGDAVQKEELFNILKGDTLVKTDETGEFGAQTTIVNGQRVINLSGYQVGANMAEEMRWGVVLGHEAYRDGVVTDDNYLETRTATAAHTAMAIRMLQGGENLALNSNLINDIIAYSQSAEYFNAYVDNNYDSSGDYWKLTREGNLEYDGNATLRDENGNVLKSYKEMGLLSDNSIEGALLWLLNVNRNDTASVTAVRDMMVASGLIHSFGTNPEDWQWKGEYTSTRYNGSFLETEIRKVTDSNMGKTISINSIAELFVNIGASGTSTNTSINNIYGSAIGFLNYADTGGTTTIAESILLNHYTTAQLGMIKTNQIWYNNALRNGININSMVVGNASRTQEFGVDSGDLSLSTSSVAGAKYFKEIHTGIDYGSGGSNILSPGGYWELTGTDDHRAYYQLFGSELKMRIMHLNPDELKTIKKNTIYGGTNNVLVNYPTQSYGSGTGAHIHIDMTMNLPYNGTYARQFVNPETLQPGNRLEYSYAYMDINKNVIQSNSGNFRRY